MKKCSNWISNHSFFIVMISCFLLVPALFGYLNTKINYDILSYLPKDIETMKGQNILTEEFGIGAFSFVFTDEINNYNLIKIEKQIKKIEGVNQVLSIADLTDQAIPLEILPKEILEKAIKENQTVIFVTFQNAISDSTTVEAIQELRKVMDDASKVSGMTSMILDTMNISKEEMNAYILLSVLFCFFVLIFATDSYLIPIFLLGNIGFAILYNMGSNIFLGQISYITQAITAVLQLGVTMDFSIFLYHKYEQQKETEKNKKRAMSYAISETFQSVIGSSLTTIAGFLALCAMSLTLGTDIGIVMAKGVIWGLICVLTLFPALLLVFDSWIEKTKHNIFFPKFNKIQKKVAQHHKLILILFIILAIPACYGNHYVEVYYKLDESLPENLPSRIANKTLAESFNIISPEIILINNKLQSKQLNQLIEEIKNLNGVDFVLSKSEIEKRGIPIEILPNEIRKVLENETYQLLFVNSIYEIASNELNDQIGALNYLVKKYDPQAIIAGEGALTKDLVEIADHDFLMVNYFSIAIIFILMLCVLKSFSLPIILVIVIEFAIFSNMAIAYFSGTTLPFIASIVVGTIQLGATIDYAILMSTTYLEERKKDTKEKAIQKTLEKTIPSIIVSALCFFAATFGVAMYSQIDMIGSICDLLSRGALISMITVSFLLPAALLQCDKIIIKTTYGMKEGKQ
ncbi:MAG: MMPL family transporter [Bacilli bacterium]|nr:MMPL family transporter [Bacilli bacterium]